MIVSSIDGRVRIKDKKLKASDIVSKIKNKLLQNEGIKDIYTNHRTGSLLILYDRTILRLEQILYVLADYIEITKTQYSKGINLFANRKIINHGMLLSFALSMFGAIADVSGLHIIAGGIFLGFLALHLLRYKNVIFTKEEI